VSGGAAWAALAAQGDTVVQVNVVPVDQFKFLGAAIFMLGAGLWFIKKAGKLLRDVSGDAHTGTGPRLKAIDPATRALLAQRGIPASQVDQMSPSEAAFMLAMLKDRAPAKTGGVSATGASTLAPDGDARGRTDTPPPAHPGMLLFCPACGAALGVGPVALPADVTCLTCDRRVTARVGGAGRIVVGVEPPR
jgi:hypothetical protein